MSLQGYQDAQDKQPMQCQPFPRSTWRTLPDCSEFQSQNVQFFWIRLPRHKRPKSWANIEDPVVLLERNLCGHPLAGFLWERHIEEVHGTLMGKSIGIGNVCLFLEDKDYSFRYTWMPPNWLEGSNTSVPCGKSWLIFENLFRFMTMCTGDALNANSNRTKVLTMSTEKMFESRISAGATEKSLYCEKPHAHTVASSHGRTCEELRGRILRIGK